ncbi:putative outer membrane starch-binding protein [Dyadobacter jejuensis]|uniref:Putative outer membrane starch-binding protein n=1 Tax=Dyadobacter jejuensis TaxID=1082580 RepID=A0A316AI60_9BACT|nr:RagB/SusD family nutrient uptake outer membrane protein [Dyadobacter jejuensis]PWJ56929.1 putative outer membrane starch-binding protein [Dyadobacter jejuensis]
MRKQFVYTIGLAITVGLASCNQEYLNPSTASEQQVINDQNGLLAMVNGLQQQFTISRAGGMYNYISASGLTTKELINLNIGNTDEANMQTGTSAVQGNNALVTNLWNKCQIVKANSDIIISNIAAAKDPSIQAKILSNTHFYRALALGTLATFWEQSPIQVGEQAIFSDRMEVLKEALVSIEAGLTAANTNATSIVGGVAIQPSLLALKARYYLMLGEYQKAYDAAELVDLSVKSAFLFDNISRNPLYETSFSNRNVCEPMSNFGLPTALTPVAGDGRLSFYYNFTSGKNLGLASFFTANSSSIPVFLPGEILLIKAECLARMGKTTESISELNKVLTKTTDVWGLGANLPTYSGTVTQEAILLEIYRQRCIELFLSGLRIEDSRRFGRPTSERSRDYYPYPLTERNNNFNTPADPTN